ncbi:MAG: LD-carboxypeptidase [Polyangiales bacterium]
MDREASFVAPRALRPGSVVAVVAPSGPFDRDLFLSGVRKLEARYEVRFESEIYSKHGFLAGRDERRAEEMLSALLDPRVEAIVCARGGYGATRLLETLDVELVRSARKLLVGFSDVTALHALWARAGVRSIHGSMVAALGRSEPALFGRWLRAVEGGTLRAVSGLATVRGGVAEGLLVGGNLSVLCAMLGSPFVPDVRGRVVFLEDIGEQPYRVDRMLTSLHHAGWFRGAAAVVLGAFTDSRPGRDGVTVDEVLRERFSLLGIPVVSGLRAGHVDDNLELPFGTRVRVDADHGTLVFLEPATHADLVALEPGATP